MHDSTCIYCISDASTKYYLKKLNERFCVFIQYLFAWMIIFFVCAEPDYAPLTSHLPFFFTNSAPFPHPSVSPSSSLSVSLSQCQWQGLLHEQTASVLGANFSQLWGCGEQPFISGKQTRPITSSGGWCGQGGRGTGGDQQVFFFFFPSPSIPKSESSKYPCTYTCTRAGYEGLGPQSKEWCQFSNYVLINIPHHLPKGSVSSSVGEPLLFLLLKAFFPSLATIGIWVATAVTCKIYLQKKTLGFQVRLFSFLLSHSSARNRHSISEDDRNASSRWMTLVCSRPSSVCVLPSEIKLQCINQHAGQR